MHAVVGVVVHALERQDPLEQAAVELLGRLGSQQAADLGRQHVAVARQPAQRLADPVLGQAEPVERGGVEQAHAGIVGRADRGARLLVRELLEEVAERRAAEADHRHLETGLAEPPPVGDAHHVRLSLPAFGCIAARDGEAPGAVKPPGCSGTRGSMSARRGVVAGRSTNPSLASGGRPARHAPQHEAGEPDGDHEAVGKQASGADQVEERCRDRWAHGGPDGPCQQQAAADADHLVRLGEVGGMRHRHRVEGE